MYHRNGRVFEKNKKIRKDCDKNRPTRSAFFSSFSPLDHYAQLWKSCACLKLTELHDESDTISRFSLKAPSRTRRLFKFHNPGRFQQLAQRLRTKVGDASTCSSTHSVSFMLRVFLSFFSSVHVLWLRFWLNRFRRKLPSTFNPFRLSFSEPKCAPRRCHS